MKNDFCSARKRTVVRALAASAVALAGVTAFAAPPIVSSPTSALAAPAGSTKTTFSISSDGHVHAVTFNGSAWTQQDLTASTNSVTAVPGSALATNVNNAGAYAVYFFDGSGSVNAISQSGGVWYWDALSAQSSAPYASTVASLTAVYLPTGHTRVYYVGPAGHVEEISDNPGATGWGVTDLTATAGATGTAATGTAMSSLLFAQGGSYFPRVYYFDTTQHLQELAYGSGWHATDITASSGGPTAIAGSALTSFNVSNNPRVYYFDGGQHVQEMAYGSGWHATDVTLRTSALPGVHGSALTSIVWNGGADLQVFFSTYDNHVRRLNWGSDGWTTQDISAMTCTTSGPAAGSELTSSAAASTYGVFYTSADAHIHELQVVGGSWSTIDINGAGIASTCAPTGGGGGGGGSGPTHPAL